MAKANPFAKKGSMPMADSEMPMMAKKGAAKKGAKKSAKKKGKNPFFAKY